MGFKKLWSGIRCQGLADLVKLEGRLDDLIYDFF